MKKFFQKIFYEFYQFLLKQNKYYLFKKNIKKGFLIMGKHSYGMPDVYVFKGSEAKVIIGKFCSIGPNCIFISGGIHPTHWISTYPFRAQWNLPGREEDGMPTTKGDIVVGNDVWIGSNVTILSGVKIGDGAVICAGSVVTKDVDPYSIYGGVPAKKIRSRFSDEVIKKLLKIQWWNWEEKKIKNWVHFLSSPQIDAFLEEVMNENQNSSNS